MSDRPAAAFDAFYGRTTRRVHGALVLVLDDPVRAAEATQEAMADALDQWGDRWRERPNAMGRAYGAALTAATTGVGRRRRLALVAGTARPGADPGPGAALDREAARSGLAALPADQRRVLVARYHLQLTVPDIADALQVTPGVVKERLAYARVDLHRRLGPGAGVDADDRLFHALRGIVGETAAFAGDRPELDDRLERRRRWRRRRRQLAVAALAAASAIAAGAVGAVASGEGAGGGGSAVVVEAGG